MAGARGRPISVIPARDLAEFNRLLASAVELGMPLDGALRFVRAQVRSGSLRETVASIEESVREGLPLADALRTQPHAFPEDYCAMVGAASGSGALVRILRHNQTYYALRHRTGRAVKRLLTMTVCGLMLCGVALVVVLVLAERFADIYSAVSIDLPGVTLMMLWLARHAPVMLAAVAAGVALAFLLTRFVSRLITLTDLSSFIPVWRRVQRNRNLSVACTTLALRLEAGAPVGEAIGSAREALSGGYARAALQRVRRRVEQGEQLSTAMFYERFFPRTLTWAVSLAENRGEVPQTFGTFAEVYADDLEHSFEAAQAMLTPLGIFAMAHLVGFFVIAMFLPLINVLQSLGMRR